MQCQSLPSDTGPAHPPTPTPHSQPTRRMLGTCGHWRLRATQSSSATALAGVRPAKPPARQSLMAMSAVSGCKQARTMARGDSRPGVSNSVQGHMRQPHNGNGICERRCTAAPSPHTEAQYGPATVRLRGSKSCGYHWH